MAQTILDIILRTKKSGSGVSDTTKELKKLKSGAVDVIEGLTGLSIGSLGVAAVITGIGLAAKQCVTDFVNYADEVRAMEQATGASAEESSRLIQVLDDLKVDAGDLQTAMKFMSKNGIDPSIDSLAMLSDEYLKLAPGSERNAFLLKQFGKNGMEMAEAMQQGGAALRQMAKEQSGNLILTEDQVKAAREFEKSQDALNDTFEGLKVSIGSKLMPVANSFLKWLNDVITAGDRAKQALVDQNESYEDYIQDVKAAAIATGAMNKQQAEAVAVSQAMTREQFNEIKYGEALNEMQLRSKLALDAYTASHDENIAARGRMTDAAIAEGLALAAAAQAQEDYYASMSAGEKVLSDQTSQQEALNGALGAYSRQLMFNVAAEGLDEAAKLRLARSMGMIDEETYQGILAQQMLKQMLDDGKITLEEYTRRSTELADSLDRLHNVDVTVTTTFHTIGSPVDVGGGGNNSILAGGGSGSYTVPAGYDENWPVAPGYSAGSGERVTWKVEPRGGTRASPNFNGMVVNINTPMDMQTFKEMLAKATL